MRIAMLEHLGQNQVSRFQAFGDALSCWN